MIDKETGTSIAKGRNITGFTTQAEFDMHVMDALRSWKEPMIDEWAEKLDARCMRGPFVYLLIFFCSSFPFPFPSVTSETIP